VLALAGTVLLAAWIFGRRTLSEMSEEINNFQRECRLVAGGPATDLKDVLVRLVIPILVHSTVIAAT